METWRKEPMVTSMVYYGISINTNNLFGDFYLNFLLSAVAEFPGQILCLLLLNRIGRKTMHASCMVFGGIACASTILTTLYLERDLQPITIALGLLGKIGATAAFSVLYTWTTELFPTVVRNAGMGVSSTCGSIGGLVSPFVADLSNVIDGHIGRATPLTIFGGLSVMAGLLSLFLPETLNKNLPDTIEDLERKRQNLQTMGNGNKSEKTCSTESKCEITGGTESECATTFGTESKSETCWTESTKL